MCHRHKRKEASQSIHRSAHRGIRRLTGFRPILPWLAPAPRKVEPPADLTGKYRSTQWWIPSQQPSAPEHFCGAEGCLIRAAGCEGTTLGHRIGCRKLSFFRHALFCQRRAVVNGRSVFQQQFPAVEGTGGGRRLSARVTAFAVTVVRTPWLLAGLLPVSHDGRQAWQVLADDDVRVVGEEAPGHLIPSLRTGLEGLHHQRASL